MSLIAFAYRHSVVVRRFIERHHKLYVRFILWPDLSRQMSEMANGFERLARELEAGEPALRAYSDALERSIADGIARLTPSQRARFDRRMAAGDYPLDALAAVTE